MEQSASLPLAQPFAIAGEMSVYTCRALHTELSAYLRDTAGACSVDLSGVTEMDAAGLQLLLWLRRSASAAGRGLSVRACSAAAAAALHLAGAGALAEASHP